MPHHPSPPPIRGIFRTDLRARAAYAEGAGIFRIVPAAVARPEDVEDLARLARWAHETRTPLVARGAGSAMGGGNVGSGVIVDLRRIGATSLLVDRGTLTARTGAAVTCGALEAAAAKHHLRLPPDPSSGRWATLGGMLSTNASGARSLRYGSVRRWALAAELVTAEGELVELRRGGMARDVAAIGRFRGNAWPAITAAATRIAERFPKTSKNSAGYALDHAVRSGDFLDLLIGAEGTLGFVTAITWQLDRIPAAHASLRVSVRELDQLADLVPALRALGPSTLELLDRSFLDVVRGSEAARNAGIEGNEAAVLLVELEGENAEEVDGLVLRMADAARPRASSVAMARTPAEEQQLAALRHAASPILAGMSDRRSVQVIEDACVPVERLGDYVGAVRRISAAHDVQAVIFGHAGDGNVHVNLLPDVRTAGWERSVQAIFDEVTAVALSLGGTPTGEHGDGRLRAPLLERVYGPEIVALFRKVKDDFDPRGILNPGIKLAAPGADGSLTDLKMGSGVAPIPDDIAATLRDLERSGGYARVRLVVAGGGV
ncbi:MAG TPA: FAD-binding oxidoreductase [Gemmatimonadales bacterium]|nr:FAD-binding oxidoreductase [Gemmatimonadales bacterium]